MLGTWHGSTVLAGVNWSMTEDSGSCSYANNQWHTNSTVTGHSDAGTYRVIDARDVEFSGSQGSAVWKLR